MKRIIIVRSLRVVLVLAILCVIVGLMIFKSYWFIILLFATLFLLDASDSMLAYRLKRIEDPQMRSSFIYVYLVAVLAGAVSGVYALISTVGSGTEECSIRLSAIDANALESIMGLLIKNPFNLFWFLFSVLVVIFAFRYYVIVVRVMARYLDTDEEY